MDRKLKALQTSTVFKSGSSESNSNKHYFETLMASDTYHFEYAFQIGKISHLPENNPLGHRIMPSNLIIFAMKGNRQEGSRFDYTWEKDYEIVFKGFVTSGDRDVKKCTIGTRNYTYKFGPLCINLFDRDSDFEATLNFSADNFREILRWESDKLEFVSAQLIGANLPTETKVKPMDTGAFCVPLRM